MTYYNYLGQPMPETPNPTVSVSGNGGNDQTITAPAGGALVVSGLGQNNVLVGGTGTDEFVVQDPTDTVQVAPNLGGVDEIYTYNIPYTLPANVNNLVVNGPYDYGAGNGGNDLIVAGDATGITLYGGGGNSVLVGGNGQDYFLVPAGGGNDVIYNWNSQDIIRLPGTSFATFAQVQAAMTQVGPDVQLQVDPNDVLIIRNTTVSQFTGSNFYLKFDPSVLGAMTFDAEFNQPVQFYNPTTGQGQFLTNFDRGPVSDIDNYTLTSNNESEVYVTPSFAGGGNQAFGINPFSSANGVLTITASLLPEQDQTLAWGRQIASGMLSTKDIFEQKYGYFEIDASFPQTPGAWPAFWMTTDTASGQEADITESLGSTPNEDDVRDYSSSIYSIENALKPGNPAGFHTYGLLWTPTTLEYTYDGAVVMVAPTPSTWTNPMYMILDLAFGGWAGQWSASQLPSDMQIAWIRAYSLADGASQVYTGVPPGESSTGSSSDPPAPSGTIQAADSGTELAGASGYADSVMLTTGQIALTAAEQVAGGGGQTGAGLEYDSGTGAQDGATITLQGYASPGGTMDPTITALPGGYWAVTYEGQGAPGDFEVYNSNGQAVFTYNPQFSQGTPEFYPMASSGYVVTNPAWSGQFAFVTGSGAWDWIPDQAVNGSPTTPSGIEALSNNGFVAWYQGSTELDVYSSTGAKVASAMLGASNSSFAMNLAALSGGDFATAWLQQPAAGSSNWELTFQTFGATGAPITTATGVAVDQDPWHTQIEVLAGANTEQAILLWSQGGALWGVEAQGSAIGTPTALLAGSLDATKAVALSNGDIALAWIETDSGVRHVWADVINPATMTGVLQELGQGDSDLHLVAVGAGFAASWQSAGQYEARGYDGAGNYGPVASVSGDFIGVDAAGQIVAVGPDGHGGALLQHYNVSFTGI